MPAASSPRLWALDPRRGQAPWRASPSRPERVLHIHLSTPEEPQTSLCRALASLAGDDYRRVDWTALGTPERAPAVVAAAAELRPTLVFMQLQAPGILAPATIAAVRHASRQPDLVIASWCGDVGGVNGPFRAPGAQWAFDLAAHCDLMLYTSLSQVRAHRSRGMLNAAYLQIGYDEDRYFEGPDEAHGSGYDVAFLGANYNDRQWTNFPGHEAGLRRGLVDALRGEFRQRFGLFGHGWGHGVGHLPPARSGDIYRAAHLAVNVSICSFLERYSSDRLFRALACGTPVLMRAFEDWRSFGLVHGENVLVWETASEALTVARAWLDPHRRDSLRAIGRGGASLVREHHSWGVRMQELYPLIAAVRGESPPLAHPW